MNVKIKWSFVQSDLCWTENDLKILLGPFTVTPQLAIAELELLDRLEKLGPDVMDDYNQARTDLSGGGELDE